MPTALTAYLASPFSSRLTAAELLVTSSGAAIGSATSTNIGAHTNWIEIGLGSGNALAGAGSIGSPDGTGACLDSTVLEGNQLAAGNYSGTLSLSCSQAGKTVTGDITLRFYKVNTSTSTYTSIGTITITSQTITSTVSAFSFPATSMAAMNFNTNETLYVDCWMNVSANTMTSGGLVKSSYSNSATQGFANGSFVTPGYQSQSVTNTYSATDTLTSTDSIAATDAYSATDTVIPTDSINAEIYLPDSLTSSETDAFALAFVPIENATSDDTASNNTLAYSASDSLSSSDTVSATNPTLLNDDALSTSDVISEALSFSNSELITFLETTTLIQIANLVDDIVTLSDAISSETALVDTSTVSDSLVPTPVFSPVDTLTSTDSLASAMARTLVDTALTSQDTLTHSNEVTDTSNLVDTALLSSDSLSFFYTYSLSDSLTPSDDFSSLTTLQGYPYLGWDTFARADQSGFGTATDGQTWTVNTGNGVPSISGNEGVITNATSLTFVQLGSKTSTNQAGLVRLAVHSTSVGAAGICLRMTNSNTTYRMRINSNSSSLGFGLVRTVGGTTTNIVTTTFTPTLNTFYWIRAAVIGTNLYGKIWQDGTVEPTSWTLTTTDSNITGAGGFGLVANSSATNDTISYDNFYVVDYALGDLSVYSLDGLITSKAFSQNEAQTLTDASTTTRIVLNTDTLTLSESIVSTKGLINTYTLFTTESASETLSTSFIETGLISSDLISTVEQSTISNIAGTDTSSIDDHMSTFLEAFNPVSTFSSSDSIAFSYTYNDPYAGSSRIASDTFVRANQSGWGTASDGSVWAVGSGGLSYSITSNQGAISGTSGAGFTFLGTESTLNGEAQLTFQIKNNTSDNLGIALRVTDASNLYYAYYANNTVFIKKIVSGTTTTVASGAFTGGTSGFYHLKFMISGSVLQARAWADGSIEPANWQASGTDTALSASGKTGIYAASTTAGSILVYNYLVIDYRLADLTPLFDVTTLTDIALALDSQTTSDTFADTLVYADGDAPTLIEQSIELELVSLTESSVAPSDAIIPIPQALETYILTSTESLAEALVSLLTDATTLVDASSLFLYVPIDTLTSIETIFDVLAVSDTTTNTPTDAIDPTLIRNLADIALSETETPRTEVAQMEDPNNVDVLVFVEQVIYALNQFEQTIFSELETLRSSFALTFPLDSNTLTESNRTTVENASPALALIDTESVAYALRYAQTITNTIAETLFSSFAYQASYRIPFVIDASSFEVTQFEQTTFSELEQVAYALTLFDRQLFTLVDVSKTTVTQTRTDTLNLAFSTQSFILRFIPVEVFTLQETLHLDIFRPFSERFFLVESYLSTTNNQQLNTLTIGIELLAEILKFGPIEVLAASERINLSVSTSFAESLNLGELARYLVNQKESTTFTEQESVFYALALALQQTNALTEKNVTSLASQSTDTLIEAQQASYKLVQKAQDTLAPIDSMTRALAAALIHSSTLVENALYLLAEHTTESASTTEVISFTLATRFVGWVDILAMQDASKTTLQQNSTQTQTIVEFLLNRENPTLFDTLSAQELLRLAESYQASDSLTEKETEKTALSYRQSDLLSLLELPAWQGVNRALDTLAFAESFAKTLIFVGRDLTTLVEVLRAISANTFAEALTLAPEKLALALIYAPQETLLEREILLAILARTLIDVGLVPIELAPALGYALFDTTLQAIDALTFATYIFMNVVAIVRSGQANGVVRSGQNTAVMRSGDVKGVIS